MAHIEDINGFEEINVSAAVGGSNAVNAEGDVFAVQALLKYALTGRPAFRDFRFPRPSGNMNQETADLIRKFQVFLRQKRGIAVSVDGRIDAAKGRNAFGRKGQWTIQILNGVALETWILTGRANGHYIADLCAQFPAMRSMLGDQGVGTLNLSLEPSIFPMGSLGLGLE